MLTRFSLLHSLSLSAQLARQASQVSVPPPRCKHTPTTYYHLPPTTTASTPPRKLSRSFTTTPLLLSSSTSDLLFSLFLLLLPLHSQYSSSSSSPHSLLYLVLDTSKKRVGLDVGLVVICPSFLLRPPPNLPALRPRGAAFFGSWLHLLPFFGLLKSPSSPSRSTKHSIVSSTRVSAHNLHVLVYLIAQEFDSWPDIPSVPPAAHAAHTTTTTLLFPPLVSACCLLHLLLNPSYYDYIESSP